MKEKLATILGARDQLHLLQFWDELDEDGRQSLHDQIMEIDFDLFASLTDKKAAEIDWDELAEKAAVPPAITLADFSDTDSFQSAYEMGGAAIAAGKVAMILVAGGQGSRLGFEHPKGMFPIGPISDRTLYQFHVEHLMGRARQFGADIPLFVMTSPPTNDETTEFLRSNNHFGLSQQNLQIFCQGTMPAVDENGKFLLDQKDKLFASPDGHGGTLTALAKSGCLADMQKRGIEHVFYAQVDNPLVQICNPAMIGYHIQYKSEMTSQVVRKTDPLQKVGNVVQVGDTVQIIEYSDLPDELARMTLSDGSLKLWAGSIAVHVFETSFLARCANDADSLPFHRAHKKVPYLNAEGQLVKPTQPNATKFEKFIFDLLPSAKNAIVIEVDPKEGFCAVKNAPPADAETPAHVQQAISDLHTSWLVKAGAEVAAGVTIEINPSFAVDEKQVAEKIKQGDPYSEDRYLV